MVFPENLKYTEDHEWVRVEADGIAFIGITDFAQRELDEIVYVEVETVGEDLQKGDEFGVVEAVKTTSDLFMPVSGTVLAFNDKLNQDEGDSPELVNSDPYGEGWIVKIKMTDTSELDELMDAEAYEALIA